MQDLWGGSWLLERESGIISVLIMGDLLIWGNWFCRGGRRGAFDLVKEVIKGWFEREV